MTRTRLELDRDLARVEATIEAGAENLSPGVYNVNATGGIEAKLTGTLEALGITFQELTARPNPTGEILWLNTALKPRELIAGTRSGERHALIGYTQPTAGTFADWTLEANEDNSFAAAKLEASREGAIGRLTIQLTAAAETLALQLGASLSGLEVTIEAGVTTLELTAGGVTKKLLNSAGASDYVLLAGEQEIPGHKIFTGEIEVRGESSFAAAIFATGRFGGRLHVEGIFQLEMLGNEVLPGGETERLRLETGPGSQQASCWSLTAPLGGSTIASMGYPGLTEGTIALPENGYVIVLFNAATGAFGTNLITLTHESTKGSVTNRFRFSHKESIVLQPGDSVVLIWEGTIQKWVDLARPDRTWKTEAVVSHEPATYEITPSTTRNADVIITAVGKAKTAVEYHVLVGGVQVDTIIIPETNGIGTYSVTVPVPANTKLKVEKISGEVGETKTQVTLK